MLRGAGFADDAPMIRECTYVGLCAELVEQLRRALDISQEEGDGAGWEIRSRRVIIRRDGARV
jgi:hypothetical protein